MLIAIQRSDGGVSVMRVNDGFDPAREVAIWEEGWARPKGISAVSWIELQEANVPVTPVGLKYRECWKVNANAIDVDMTKAKALRVAELDKVRDKLIARLTARIDQAIDDGAANAVINRMRSKRKALRDLNLSSVVSAPTTVDALDIFVPTEFNNASSEL